MTTNLEIGKTYRIVSIPTRRGNQYRFDGVLVRSWMGFDRMVYLFQDSNNVQLRLQDRNWASIQEWN